jgi:hypothetical protein
VKVLSEIAEVIRSKNAGPFVVTFDVLFTTEADYNAVEAAGLVTRRVVSELYGVSENELLSFESSDRSAPGRRVTPMFTAPNSTRPCWICRPCPEPVERR